MAEHVIRLPDVGEGVAEAELVEWHVKIGDLVREDAILGAVMTDKATVEIPSPVEGEIVWLGAEIGDMVAVGSDLVRLKVAGDDDAAAPRARGGAESEGSCRRNSGIRRRRSRPHGDARARRRPRRAARSATVRRPEPHRSGNSPRRSASRRREAAGLAGGSPARARGRRRPATRPRHRSCRPHHP